MGSIVYRDDYVYKYLYFLFRIFFCQYQLTLFKRLIHLFRNQTTITRAIYSLYQARQDQIRRFTGQGLWGRLSVPFVITTRTITTRLSIHGRSPGQNNPRTCRRGLKHGKRPRLMLHLTRKPWKTMLKMDILKVKYMMVISIHKTIVSRLSHVLQLPTTRSLHQIQVKPILLQTFES